MGFKKSLILMTLTAILTLSGCAANNLNSKRWEELHSKGLPDTLPKIHKYINENIFCKPEKIENWNSPKKTIKLGHGDCDEIAVLGSYFAEKLGYEPKVLFLIDKSSDAHLVTLLEDKTAQEIKYGAIEHTDLFYPVYDSIDKMIYDMNRLYRMNYFYYSIFNLNSLDYDWRTSNRNLIHNKKKKFFSLIQAKLPEQDKAKKWEPEKNGYKMGSIMLEKIKK